jgi:hypothetical protein
MATPMQTAELGKKMEIAYEQFRRGQGSAEFIMFLEISAYDVPRNVIQTLHGSFPLMTEALNPGLGKIEDTVQRIRYGWGLIDVYDKFANGGPHESVSKFLNANIASIMPSIVFRLLAACKELAKSPKKPVNTDIVLQDLNAAREYFREQAKQLFAESRAKEEELANADREKRIIEEREMKQERDRLERVLREESEIEKEKFAIASLQKLKADEKKTPLKKTKQKHLKADSVVVSDSLSNSEPNEVTNSAKFQRMRGSMGFSRELEDIIDKRMQEADSARRDKLYSQKLDSLTPSDATTSTPHEIASQSESPSEMRSMSPSTQLRNALHINRDINLDSDKKLSSDSNTLRVELLRDSVDDTGLKPTTKFPSRYSTFNTFNVRPTKERKQMLTMKQPPSIFGRIGVSPRDISFGDTKGLSEAITESAKDSENVTFVVNEYNILYKQFHEFKEESEAKRIRLTADLNSASIAKVQCEEQLVFQKDSISRLEERYAKREIAFNRIMEDNMFLKRRVLQLTPARNTEETL